MLKIVQKLAPAPPTGLYSPAAPLSSRHQCSSASFSPLYISIACQGHPRIIAKYHIWPSKGKAIRERFN